MDGYKYNGPIDCNVHIGTKSLEGKTAVVTGGICSRLQGMTKLLTEGQVQTVSARLMFAHSLMQGNT
jgi:hypothetical protein